MTLLQPWQYCGTEGLFTFSDVAGMLLCYAIILYSVKLFFGSFWIFKGDITRYEREKEKKIGI
jgi:hypothetical protein